MSRRRRQTDQIIASRKIARSLGVPPREVRARWRSSGRDGFGHNAKKAARHFILSSMASTVMASR